MSSIGDAGDGQELALHPEYIQRYFFRRSGHFVEFISMREFLRVLEEVYVYDPQELVTDSAAEHH